MRDYGSTVNTLVEDGSDSHVRNLVLFQARNKSTGATEELALWDGLGQRDFTTDSVTRTYHGSGRILGFPPIRGGVGLEVQRHTITISHLPDDVADMLYTYDARLAPVRAWRVHFDPVKGVTVGDPYRLIKGWIDTMPIPTAAKDGSASLQIKVTSASRLLTQRVAMYQNDSMQRTVNATDRGLEYSAMTAKFWWGAQKQDASPPATTPGKTTNPGENPVAEVSSRDRR